MLSGTDDENTFVEEEARLTRAADELRSDRESVNHLSRKGSSVEMSAWSDGGRYNTAATRLRAFWLVDILHELLADWWAAWPGFVAPVARCTPRQDNGRCLQVHRRTVNVAKTRGTVTSPHSAAHPRNGVPWVRYARVHRAKEPDGQEARGYRI